MHDNDRFTHLGRPTSEECPGVSPPPRKLFEGSLMDRPKKLSDILFSWSGTNLDNSFNKKKQKPEDMLTQKRLPSAGAQDCIMYRLNSAFRNSQDILCFNKSKNNNRGTGLLFKYHIAKQALATAAPLHDELINTQLRNLMLQFRGTARPSIAKVGEKTHNY